MHTKLKILCVLLAILVYTEAKADLFIVGGYPAKNISVPYIASVSSYGLHLCGGTIINERTVLTSALCIPEEQLQGGMKVFVGSKRIFSSEGQIVRIKTIILHKKFSITNGNNNIALARLSRSLEFGPKLQPIRLDSTGNIPTDGTRGLICGWGKFKIINDTMPAMVHCTSATIIQQSVCRDLYNKANITITKNMLCAGHTRSGIGPCDWDMGGPLIIGKRLVGIISFAMGCEEMNWPSVYTSIGALRPWVESILAKKYNETLED